MDDVRRVRAAIAEGDVTHDHNHGVFFDVEVVVRIKTPAAKRSQVDGPCRDGLREEDAAGVGQQLRDQRDDVHGGVPQGEELVDSRTEDGEDDAQDPHAEGVDRYAGVVDLRDDSAD